MIPLIASILILSGIGLQAAPPGTVAARLAEYERQVEGGRGNPAELAAIATSVAEAARQAPAAPAILIAACESRLLPSTPDCDARLLRLWRDAATAFAIRAQAAAVRAKLGKRSARGDLAAMLSRASLDDLSAAADTALALPASQAVTILSRLLALDSPSAPVAGCRVLGQVEGSDARSAALALVQEYRAAAPRGTPPHQACTLAAARLGDLSARTMLNGIINASTDTHLVEAADIVAEQDPERATDLLLRATREGSSRIRLLAARRLIPSRPDVATTVMEEGLSSSDPELQAAALEVHRGLGMEANARVRQLLVSPQPLVRLRAAETILAYAIKLGHIKESGVR